MPAPGLIPEFDEATHATTRYLAALTGLTDEQAASPSALPGWSRAHVVAHLSRNADAFTRVLGQVAEGEPATMYDSAERRDAEIDETVRTHDLAALVQDARTSSERLAAAAAACRRDGLATTYKRTPADPDAGAFVVAGIGQRRRTEVEAHSTDLLLGYLPSQWPEEFSRSLVRRRVEEITGAGGPSMLLSATDVAGLWKVGEGPGPEVSGSVGDLAWWLIGRGQGVGLVSSTGELPPVPRWR